MFFAILGYIIKSSVIMTAQISPEVRPKVRRKGKDFSAERRKVNWDNILMLSAFVLYLLFTLKGGFVFQNTKTDTSVIKKDSTIELSGIDPCLIFYWNIKPFYKLFFR